MATRPIPGDHLLPATTSDDERSLAALFKELASDTGELVRHEIELAKLELKETAVGMATDSVKIVAALGMVILGGLAAVVALILGIGVLLGGSYWGGAAITAGLLLLTGGLLTGSALEGMKSRSVKPKATAETLKEDARFAKREVKALKQRITG